MSSLWWFGMDWSNYLFIFLSIYRNAVYISLFIYRKFRKNLPVSFQILMNLLFLFWKSYHLFVLGIIIFDTLPSPKHPLHRIWRQITIQRHFLPYWGRFFLFFKKGCYNLHPIVFFYECCELKINLSALTRNIVNITLF